MRVVICLCLFLSTLLPWAEKAQTNPTAVPLVNAADSFVPTQWYMLNLQLIRKSHRFTPPLASRALGYIGITLYEALVPGMPDYQSLAGLLNDLPTIPSERLCNPCHWQEVANAALAQITRHLLEDAFVIQRERIDTLEAQFAEQFVKDAAPEVLQSSAEWGRAVAEHIFEWSKSDGGHEAYQRSRPKGYVSPKGDGLWIPTPPRYIPPLQPQWGNNRPFLLPSGAACAVAPPPAFSSEVDSQFYQAALEVYTTVKALTPEQKLIARYWADDPWLTITPPGHSLAIATQVLEQEDASLEMAAITYAKLGIAVADSFIACWHDKYTWNLIRPLTYIQRNIDATWNKPSITDPVITPPFPSYPSGHASDSAAAMAVLTDLFGANYHFTDRSREDAGFAPRSFDSFMQAAEEAAISRLYGGIHYRFDSEAGLQQGKCVGERVNRLPLRRK